MKNWIMAISAVVLVGCSGNESSGETEALNIEFQKEGTLSFVNAAGQSKTLDLELAIQPNEQQQGLMYRDSMTNQQGMLFEFDAEQAQSFYMKNTRIPLDIIYISADSTVVDIKENAEPYNTNNLPSELPAKYVLELNSGQSKALGMVKGQTKLSWKKIK